MSDLHSALLADGDKQALVTALARAAGIAIPARHLAEVSTHLVIAAGMAQALFAAEVATDAPQAPVYAPSVACAPTQGAAR